MKRTTEDYLKTIRLLRDTKNSVRCVDVAKALNVSRPTVTATVKRLEKEGFLRKGPGYELALTEAGDTVAREVLKRHRFFEEVLQTLGVDAVLAASDACRLEHAVSAESFEALDRFCRKALNL